MQILHCTHATPSHAANLESLTALHSDSAIKKRRGWVSLSYRILHHQTDSERSRLYRRYSCYCIAICILTIVKVEWMCNISLSRLSWSWREPTSHLACLCCFLRTFVFFFQIIFFFLLRTSGLFIPVLLVGSGHAIWLCGASGILIIIVVSRLSRPLCLQILNVITGLCWASGSSTLRSLGLPSTNGSRLIELIAFTLISSEGPGLCFWQPQRPCRIFDWHLQRRDKGFRV